MIYSIDARSSARVLRWSLKSLNFKIAQCLFVPEDVSSRVLNNAPSGFWRTDLTKEQCDCEYASMTRGYKSALEMCQKSYGICVTLWRHRGALFASSAADSRDFDIS